MCLPSERNHNVWWVALCCICSLLMYLLQISAGMYVALAWRHSETRTAYCAVVTAAGSSASPRHLVFWLFWSSVTMLGLSLFTHISYLLYTAPKLATGGCSNPIQDTLILYLPIVLLMAQTHPTSWTWSNNPPQVIHTLCYCQSLWYLLNMRGGGEGGSSCCAVSTMVKQAPHHMFSHRLKIHLIDCTLALKWMN